MSLLLFPYKGVEIIQLVVLNLGAPMHLVVILILVTSLCLEVLILWNKVDAMPYANQSQMGGYAQYLIPNRLCILM